MIVVSVDSKLDMMMFYHVREHEFLGSIQIVLPGIELEDGQFLYICVQFFFLLNKDFVVTGLFLSKQHVFIHCQFLSLLSCVSVKFYMESSIKGDIFLFFSFIVENRAVSFYDSISSSSSSLSLAIKSLSLVSSSNSPSSLSVC